MQSNRRIGNAAWPVAALLLAVLAAEASAQGAGWTRKSEITVNTSSSGAGVSGSVEKYPVAVILNAMNFEWDAAKEDGSDLRFTKSDGVSPLPFEIEHFDKAAKSGAAWVLFDVQGNSASQAFHMHYGNPGATAAGDGKAVFGTGNGWLGAWHLSDPAGTGEGGYKDASGTGAHATGMNTAEGSSVPSRVGKGLKLVNAQKQWVKYDGAKLSQFNTAKQMTVSVWGLAHAFKNPNGKTPGYETVFSKGDGAYVIQKFSMNNKWEACIKAGGHYCAISSKATTQLNQWFHFTLVLDHPSIRFYVNGVADGTSGNGGTWSQGAHPIGIGTQSQYLGENRYWEGFIDEARILGTTKDINWIKLDYELQKEGSTAVTVGKTATRLVRRTIPGYLAADRSASPRWDIQGRSLGMPLKGPDRSAAQRLFFLPLE